jgi:hypothetical protein
MDMWGERMEWPREGKVGEGEDRVLLFGWQLRGRRNQREKAGIGEKGVLVLWSGLCGVAVAEMEKWRGSLVAGLERTKKIERWRRRRLGFSREKKN